MERKNRKERARIPPFPVDRFPALDDEVAAGKKTYE